MKLFSRKKWVWWFCFWFLPLCPLVPHVYHVWGRDMIIITYPQKTREVDQIQEILLQQYHLPPILIKMRQKENSCEAQRGAILQICVDTEGLIHIPFMDKAVLEETFDIFSLGFEK